MFDKINICMSKMSYYFSKNIISLPRVPGQTGTASGQSESNKEKTHIQLIVFIEM